MSPDGRRIVDVNAQIDRVVRELEAAGFEDEDDDLAADDGRLDVPGDGRLG